MDEATRCYVLKIVKDEHDRLERELEVFLSANSMVIEKHRCLVAAIQRSDEVLKEIDARIPIAERVKKKVETETTTSEPIKRGLGADKSTFGNVLDSKYNHKIYGNILRSLIIDMKEMKEFGSIDMESTLKRFYPNATETTLYFYAHKYIAFMLRKGMIRYLRREGMKKLYAVEVVKISDLATASEVDKQRMLERVEEERKAKRDVYGG